MLAAGAAVFKGQAGANSTYIGRVLGYRPDWYLPLGDPMATAQVGASGSYQNSPQLGVDPIAQDDSAGKSVGLSGAATSPPHITVSSPLSAASFTIHLLVQLDSITKTKHVLITTGGGPSLGDFSLEVLANGQMRAWSEDGIVREILGTAGDVPQGEAVSVVYQRQSDAAGWSQRVYVNGALKAEDTVQRTWPSLPSQTWYIGAWSDLSDATDGLIAHVAGWNSLLTPIQISDLARANSVAWAEDIDAGAVQESGSVVVNVRQGGWHGKLPLVATAGDGSLVTTTESGEEITVTAVGTVGTDDTFSYSFTDDNGNTTATKTVTIDVIEEAGEYITTPEAHGWDDENTDLENTAAFQDAIDDANTNAASSGTGRGVVELLQGKTYTVRVNANGTSSSAPVNALTAKSNVEIRTTGKPTRASGNQAIVKWHSWAGFGDASIKHRNLLWISNVSNFHCGYIQFHGNKNTMPSRFTMDYSSGTNGGMNCLSLRNTISNIFIKELDVQHAGTDGMLASCESATGVLVEDCNFTRGRRQGLSMGRNNVAGSGHDEFIFRRCRFEDTGDFPGDIEGLQPGYGVDIEPDQTSNHVYGVTFDDCDFLNNLGSLYINQDQVTSTLFGHGLAFDCKATAANIKVINCTGTGNTTRGLSLGLREAPTWEDWHIENFVSTGNGDNAMRISASGSGTGGRITDMTIINCNISSIAWESGGFPSPWDTGWSVTIWKGDFNPSVITNGVETVTVNNGFPP